MKRFVNPPLAVLETSLTYKPFQYLMACAYVQASGVMVMYAGAVGC